MTKAFTFAAFISTATTAAAGETDRQDDLLQLIRDNGCQMTFVEADEMLPDAGFTQAETRDLVREMNEAGLVELSGFAGIKLSDKGCNG